MLGITYFWFWIVEVVIFVGVAIFLLLSDYAPWWVWLGFAGAFILLSLLVLANFRLRPEDDS
jgi:hypothetical protein